MCAIHLLKYNSERCRKSTIFFFHVGLLYILWFCCSLQCKVFFIFLVSFSFLLSCLLLCLLSFSHFLLLLTFCRFHTFFLAFSSRSLEQGKYCLKNKTRLRSFLLLTFLMSICLTQVGLTTLNPRK